MNYIEKELLQKANSYGDSIKLYQDLYKTGHEEYHELPILRKKDLLQDQKLVPPFGSNLQVSIAALERVHRTSGISDTPLLLALTKKDIENVARTGRKAFELAGLGKDDIIINCMNYCMWMGGFMDHQSLAATGAAVIPYGVGNTENLIRLILSIPGVCIHSTPSYLGKIEQIAKEKFGLLPAELHIKKGLFGGEGGLSEKNFRKKLTEKWGMDVYDANYGMSEVMSIIASEDAAKDGLNFIAGDTVYPEIYLRDKQCAANSFIQKGTVGELVLSNRCKEAQPLIRYGTGDVIEIIDVNKNEDPVLEFKFRVVGRSDDMIVVKGINFYPAALRSLIASCALCTGVYQVQILKEPIIDKVRVIVELEHGDRESELSELRMKLQHEIKKKYFVTCNIVFTEQIKEEGNKLKLIERVDSFE